MFQCFTLLAHIQPPIDKYPQVLFLRTAFQPLLHQPVALCGVVVPRVQDPTLRLVELDMAGLSPVIQPVWIPL